MAPWSFDALLGCLLILAASWGAQQGFIRQIVWPLSWTAGLVGSMHHSETLVGLIELSQPWNEFASSFLLGLGAFVAVRVLRGNIARAAEKKKSRQADQFLGALLGAGKGALVVVALTVIGMVVLPLHMLPRESYTVLLTQQFVEHSYALLSPELQQTIQPWYALILE